MAARGYEFYLRVLKSERSEQVRDTFSTRNSYIKHKMKFLHKTQPFFIHSSLVIG